MIAPGDLVRSPHAGLCRVVQLEGRRAVLDWVTADGSGPWRQEATEDVDELELVETAARRRER